MNSGAQVDRPASAATAATTTANAQRRGTFRERIFAPFVNATARCAHGNDQFGAAATVSIGVIGVSTAG